MKEIWLGLAEVTPKQGNDILKGAEGAYVNVIALAISEEEYTSIVKSELLKYGFNTLAIGNIELLSDRRKTSVVDDELLDLASLINEENIAQFDEFQAFSERY
ncbi:hypothetical protein FKG94_26445 [Exilibacterium tricleocarpae]|uniref:Uncharacterized protein n=1 Tax=Exilibacterium tricleocarpae TaxID=2591008 RepID=A0A545SPW9_9GAMM|nr:hypothetical protein [Exilibacterium tricleocarpae]TQV67011.1 hypothetical protein FKG94_26445 [Exilibacterium tricleocarpae]